MMGSSSEELDSVVAEIKGLAWETARVAPDQAERGGTAIAVQRCAMGYLRLGVGCFLCSLYFLIATDSFI
jgi:hypothetical protein